MARIRVRRLERLRTQEFRRVVTGYLSRQKYRVVVSETRADTSFRLTRVPLPSAFVKVFPCPTDGLRHYRKVMRGGWCLGAYDGKRLVGLALAERRDWNRSLWVWELGVAESYRRRGIGRRLVDALSRRARAAGLRVVVCETQTTNVPAIDFYRRVGFTVEGIDLSYYSNDDLRTGEVAIFMKRRLEPQTSR